MDCIAVGQLFNDDGRDDVDYDDDGDDEDDDDYLCDGFRCSESTTQPFLYDGN